MKTVSKITALILALLFILPLGACGDATGSGDTTTAVTTEATDNYLDVFCEGSDYKIIRGEDMSNSEMESFKKLKNAIVASAGVTLALETDWDKNSDFTAAHEIVLGDTSRPESAEALKKVDGKGYVITVINEKIVINATTSKLLGEAVDKFIELYLTDTEKKIPKNLLEVYIKSAEDNPLYKFNSVSINGVDIKDFTVVVNNLSKYDLPIYTLTAFFSDYANVTLSAKAESAVTEGHKIVIGGKKADGSDYATFETELWFKDGDLHLGCANATMAQKAIYTFIDQYFGSEKNVAIEMAEGASLFNSTVADDWDNANPKDVLAVRDTIIRGCYKLQSILEYDHSIGNYYTYQNSGYAYSIAKARKADNRTTNCVIVDNWVMIDAGFYTKGIYNIKYDGTTGYSYGSTSGVGSVPAFFKENMVVYDLRSENISIKSLYNEGRVLPGDLVLYKNHMQITLPHFNAFDGGRGNTKEKEVGSVFKYWVGANPYPSMIVGFVFRDKNVISE